MLAATSLLLLLLPASLAAPSTKYKGSIGTFGSTSHSVTPAMCSDSVFPSGSFGSPQGAGFCSTPEAEFGCCYKFSDYPGLQQLEHNLTFVFMPTNYYCDLFLNKKCTGEFTTVVSGENEFTNGEFGNVNFNDRTGSFKCFSS